jgi:hypothetical protein
VVPLGRNQQQIDFLRGGAVAVASDAARRGSSVAGYLTIEMAVKSSVDP